ncbi:MAG: DUF1667 domain-containing protein [Halarsenatibacteraceae bacterium]
MDERTIICLSCPKGCRVRVKAEDDEIKDISGHECPQGIEYAKNEYLNPTRILPTRVRVKNGQIALVPVKTAAPIPKEKIGEAMQQLSEIEVEAPIELGQVIVENIADTGVDVVATRSIKKKN